MKIFFAILFALALTASATPAVAYVVEVTTSVDLSGVTDKAHVGDAVASAIEDVLKHAIAFSPTVVTLQSARVVGDRMYLLLMIADQDGEKAIEAMSGERAAAQ